MFLPEAEIGHSRRIEVYIYIYTTSLAMAARYGTTHYFHDPACLSHPWVVKMALVVAIPGVGGNLPGAAWRHADRSGMTPSQKRKIAPRGS